MQSSANATGAPSSSDSRSATGLRLNSGFGLPFGRPRWLASTTVAPCSSAYWIVGSDDWIRVSSPITPFLSGTLKSTRMKTRLPLRSRSLIESFISSAEPSRYRPFATSMRSRSTQRFE